MKWIYGKQDWKTFERGQENCYLMTNGLGGFSSLTMTGSAARNDHAFLMACTKAPNNRYNVIHRLAEQIEEGYQTHGHTLCPVCVQGERCRGGAGVPVRGRTDPERRPDPFDQDGCRDREDPGEGRDILLQL